MQYSKEMSQEDYLHDSMLVEMRIILK
jgi:hypothetical protein